MMTMKPKIFVLTFCAVSILGTAGAASAETRKHARGHHHSAYGLAPAAVVPRGPAFAPGPHMIEARPGVWISSWDCITDEGGGRWRPCSSLGGGGARP